MAEATSFRVKLATRMLDILEFVVRQRRPIIAQDVAHISHADTSDDLVRKGRDIERRVLAEAVRNHLEDRVFLNGSRTAVFKTKAVSL